MYAELNDASQAAVSSRSSPPPTAKPSRWRLTRARPRLRRRPAARAKATTVVPVPIAVTTVAFGSFEDELDLPFAEGGIDWDPSLVFPGLRDGEHLESEIELAPRAAILAADGTPLAEGPADEREHPLGSAAIDVTGEVGEASEEADAEARPPRLPAETPVGISGLEQAFNRRLAGKPGGKLLAVAEAGRLGRAPGRSRNRSRAPR